VWPWQARGQEYIQEKKWGCDKPDDLINIWLSDTKKRMELSPINVSNIENLPHGACNAWVTPSELDRNRGEAEIRSQTEVRDCRHHSNSSSDIMEYAVCGGFGMP
jgi:hypothetical protein